MNLFDRAREAWRVFRGRDHPSIANQYSWPGVGMGWYTGPSSPDRPDRFRMRPGNERTLVNAAYNRIALDCAIVEVHHAFVDENDVFTKVIKDDLEERFTVEANVDQTSMAYMVDLVMSMFDEGVVAEAPIDNETRLKGVMRKPTPEEAANGIVPSQEIEIEYLAIGQLRTAKVVEWRPQEVTIECYNEKTGSKEQITACKREIAIHENPFYSVMNEKNSIFSRLVRKLNLLDMVDENNGSEKMNLILQLPYIIRNDIKRAEAQNRLKELESQLKESKYGIGYVDGTEKILQLNRPIENNLQKQIEWLTDLFFSQLGITREILNGTADEKTMSNYLTRCVGVIMQSICLERRRKFLTKAQRDNGESIVYVQDPLRLIPVTSIADIFDKLTRNAILSPNECRGILGYKPSEDPQANELVNRNMPISETPGAEVNDEGPPEEKEEGELAHSALYGKVHRKERSKVPRIYLRE